MFAEHAPELQADIQSNRIKPDPTQSNPANQSAFQNASHRSFPALPPQNQPCSLQAEK